MAVSARAPLDCGTRSVGDRCIPSSASSHLKNCCRPLCLFNAVDADRVPIIQA